MVNKPNLPVVLGKGDQALTVLGQSVRQEISGYGNIQAGGHIYMAAQVNPLSSMLKALDLSLEDSAELKSISDELLTYFTDRDVIGLEGKLAAAGRSDLLEDARYEKHRFSQKIARLQFSLQLRKVYHHILSMLVQRFRGRVLPLIHAGGSNADIDKEITEIVGEIYCFTSASEALNLTETDIQGMIYFLTGGCHLKWSK